MFLCGHETLSLILREELKSVWDHGAEENTWNEKGWNYGKVEKTAHWGGTPGAM